MTVFISHTSDDAATAKRLEDLIAYDGYKSWRFQRDMMTANPADPQLPSNIEASDTFLILHFRPFAAVGNLPKGTSACCSIAEASCYRSAESRDSYAAPIE